jgi:hypothetical protein
MLQRRKHRNTQERSSKPPKTEQRTERIRTFQKTKQSTNTQQGSWKWKIESDNDNNIMQHKYENTEEARSKTHPRS